MLSPQTNVHVWDFPIDSLNVGRPGRLPFEALSSSNVTAPATGASLTPVIVIVTVACSTGRRRRWPGT